MISPTTPMILQLTKNANCISAFPACWAVQSTRFYEKGTPIVGLLLRSKSTANAILIK